MGKVFRFSVWGGKLSHWDTVNRLFNNRILLRDKAYMDEQFIHPLFDKADWVSYPDVKINTGYLNNGQEMSM